MRARPLALLALSSLVSAPLWAAEAGDLAVAQKALDENPDDAKGYETFATLALGQNKFDEAIARTKIGVARIPDFTTGYYLLAYAYRKKLVWADAADFYRVCISLRYKETESYFGLGQSLAGLGDKRGALAALKKYVSIEKRPGAAKFVDEANKIIAALEPPAAPAADAAKLRAEADGLRKEKKLEDAAAAYKRAIAADKNNLELYNDLGNVYFGLKKYDDAAQAFKDATGRDEKYSLGWYNLAHALRKGARNAEAVEAYKKYMKLKPDDPDAYYGLGQTLKALGDQPGAVAAFQKYVEMEKRPDQQKWVEKAKAELQVLNPGVVPPSSGKISDDK